MQVTECQEWENEKNRAKGQRETRRKNGDKKIKSWWEKNDIRILWEHFCFPIDKIVTLLTTGTVNCQASEIFFKQQVLDSFSWLQINWGRRES